MKKLIIGVILGLYLVSPSIINGQTGVTYYVDCNSGVDTNSGTSVNTAWRTVARANSATLNPGDRLLFKRGCTWTNTADGNFLVIRWSGTNTNRILIGAYGTGNKPLLQTDARATSTYQNSVMVTGNFLTVEDLQTKTINHHTEATCTQADGNAARLGWYSGFSVQGDNNILRNLEVSNQSLGVFLQDSSNNNIATNVYVHDMSTFWRIYHSGGAMGAMGVNAHGTNNEISHSLFERNKAECTDNNGNVHNYSAPFEIYNANRVYIHHNRAYGHRKHLEMGKDSTSTSADNVVAYNLFVSDHPKAVGPNIHGNDVFGPILRTQVYNNTVVFTGAESQALAAGGGGVFKNNIFVAEWKAAFYGGNITESNNIYWDMQRTTDASSDPFVQFGSGATQQNVSTSSQRVNPLFINAIVPGGDYRLQSASPAINRGVIVASSDQLLLSILSLDLDGVIVPLEASPEAGSYEFGGSTSLTPTPSPTAHPTSSPSATTRPTNSPTPSPRVVLAGDLNDDGIVNIQDYVIFSSLMGTKNTQADFNHDGEVNIQDFIILSNNFGKTI